MRAIVLLLLVLLLSPGHVFSEAISITSKPAGGLTGTTSFNFHKNGEVTLLQYKSPTNIIEVTINIEPEKTEKVANISHEVIAEYYTHSDYSKWPVQKETIAVAITKEKVTKSVSTNRHSEKIKYLMALLKDYIPENAP